jgi:hypothetical protein
VTILRQLNREEHATLLEKDLDETEAIVKALQEAALEEVREEMAQEKQAEEEGGGAKGQQQQQTKKLSRKQQKRKAAAKRKQEEQRQQQAQQQEQQGGTVEGGAAAAAAGALEMESLTLKDDATLATAAGGGAHHTHTHAHTPQQEPEEEKEKEEEEGPECSVCLGEIEEEGGENETVLLACTHLFHFDCLRRWKEKCIEKEYAVTCPYCRASLVVVEG